MPDQQLNIKPRKRKKRRVHWHLLMIADNGKVLNFQRYKLVVFFIILLIGLSTSSAVWLFRLYQDSYRENKMLKEALAESENSLKVIKSENETLSARLIMAGMDQNGNGNKKSDYQIGGETQKTEKNAEAKDSVGNQHGELDIKTSEKVIENNSQEKGHSHVLGVNKKSDMVDIKDFSVTYDTEKGNLNLKMRISNISKQTVSGYLFVVLRNHQTLSDSWLTLPEKIVVNDGIASNYESGHKFKISKFKPVTFSVQHHENLGNSFIAEVLVFGNDGNLLLTKDFPVNI